MTTNVWLEHVSNNITIALKSLNLHFRNESLQFTSFMVKLCIMRYEMQYGKYSNSKLFLDVFIITNSKKLQFGVNSIDTVNKQRVIR